MNMHLFNFIKNKQFLIIFLIFLILLSAILIFKIIKIQKLDETDRSKLQTQEINKVNSKVVSDLTYDQVLNSKLGLTDVPEVYESKYNGEVIKWQAKISARYSQITGIKFCIVDNDHQNIDINEPCDWFWAASDEVMNADDTKVNPGWDGYWVKYVLNYYKVPINENEYYYNDIYTITGIVNQIDCGVHDRCAPNIDIISITPGTDAS